MTRQPDGSGHEVPDDLSGATEEELFDLHHRHRQRRVRNELVERNMGFAYYLAGRFASRGQEREDLNQVALAALVRAVDRYDPTRGVPFNAYAGITIEGSLKRHFRDYADSIRIPRSARQLSHRVRHAVNRLEQDDGRSPTPEEVAEHLDVPVEDVLNALAAEDARRPDSLDAGMGDDGPTLNAFLGEDDVELSRADSRLTAAALLELLDERERTVVELRFFDDLPQVAIAERIGVSQMQVSRILRRAVTRLHDYAAEVLPPPESVEGPLVSDLFAMRPDTMRLGVARDEFTRWLRRHAIGGRDAEDLQLIWSELVTNALHQSPERPILIEVSLWEGSPQIHMTIVNDDSLGVELPARADWRPEDPLAPRGRGLFIVDQLCKSVEWVNRRGRTSVTVRYAPEMPVGVPTA